jgi:hypothetical protein
VSGQPWSAGDPRRTVRVDCRTVVVESRAVRELDGRAIVTTIRLNLLALDDAHLVDIVQRRTRPLDFTP